MQERAAQSLLILLAFVAFVSLGLPDCVLGVAWPSIRVTFGKPLGHIGAILFCGMGGYLVSSFLAGQVVRAVGIGRLLVGSSLLVAIALTGYSLAPAWGWLLVWATLGGLGAGAVDAGINTFAASHFSHRVVNWLHASWGIGATTGPLLMTAALAGQWGWRGGYAVVATALGVLGALFLATLRLWDVAAPGRGDAASSSATLREAVRRPIVWLHVSVFFAYAGLEATTGGLLYSLLTEQRGVPPTTAGIVTGAYWGALTAGRVVFGQLAVTLSRRAILRMATMGSPVAAGLLWWSPSIWVGYAAVALLGFLLGPIFPTLISVTPQRTGEYYAPQAVGFQVAAATLGIGLLPGFVGHLARFLTLEVLGPWLVVTGVVLLLLNELATRTCER